MAVTPKYETYNFCYWLQNLSWQRLTTPQSNLVTIIATASQNQTTVTNQQWKDFNMISSSRYQNYLQWISLSTVQSGYLSAWLAVLPATPPAWYVSAVSRFIDTLVNAGIWSKLDRLWLFASPTSAISLYSIVNPTSSACVLVSSPAFEPYQGFTGNGVSAYIDTMYNPATNAVNFTQNSASMGAYTRIQASVASGKCILGRNDATKYNILQLRYTGDKLRTLMNSGGVDVQANNTSTQGFFSGVRSGANALSVWRNGVSLGSSAVASSGLVNNTIHVFSRGGLDYVTNQASLIYFGSSAIDQFTFYGAIYQLSREIGFNV